ncbi:hypothetical protein BK734_32370 [Bacillus thuringiensis serovar kim]|nr:hypothetical protein BK734_32370 [Bacillus thuringiensis serovar kim]
MSFPHNITTFSHKSWARLLWNENISAHLEIYQRLSKYIGASRNISAIIKIYRLTDRNRQ